MPHPDFLDSTNPAIYTLRTTAPGSSGQLPITASLLRAAPPPTGDPRAPGLKAPGS